MGSIANQKGGYYTSLDVFRDNSSTSATVLKDPLLKNTQNYICQVQKFITNVTPAINTFKDVTLFEIFTKPYDGEPSRIFNANDLLVSCRLGVCRSVGELARQITDFCLKIGGLDCVVGMDYMITFKLSPDFGDNFYLKFDKTFAELVGLDVYQSYFYNAAGIVTKSPFMTRAEFITGGGDPANYQGDFQHYYTPAPFPANAGSHGPISNYSLLNYDTRVSLDVSLTIQHPSVPEILDGKEGRHKLIARFPLKDYKETFVEADNSKANSYTLRESIFLGTEDLTRGSPDTNTTILYAGDFSHAVFRVETRYIEEKQFKRVPTSLGTHGFWNMKLLFAKKIK